MFARMSAEIRQLKLTYSCRFLLAQTELAAQVGEFFMHPCEVCPQS